MKNEETKTIYTVIISLDYSSNKGDPDTEAKHFSTLEEAESYYNDTLLEECTEHGKTCQVTLYEVGNDEPIKSDYQESALLPTGAIIVTYTHSTYMGYAYNIIEVNKARDGSRYEDLYPSVDNTNRNWDAIYSNVAELEGDYKLGNGAPMNKINKGRGIIEAFLCEEGIEGYEEETETGLYLNI